MREENNIELVWEKPFEVPNLPPSFKGGGKAVGGGKAESGGEAVGDREAAGGGEAEVGEEAVDCSKMEEDEEEDLNGNKPVFYSIYNNRS